LKNFIEPVPLGAAFFDDSGKIVSSNQPPPPPSPSDRPTSKAPPPPKPEPSFDVMSLLPILMSGNNNQQELLSKLLSNKTGSASELVQYLPLLLQVFQQKEKPKTSSNIINHSDYKKL